MDFAGIEEKWRAAWEAEAIFQPNPSPAAKKFYLTAAFPYPNSPQHIGHGRTYTTTDIYGRFKRMQGYNVLFPMGFHVTGTPILGMAKRIEARDQEILDIFEQIYNIPPETALGLTDPKQLVTYFSKEIEEGMKEMGYSIDWRRKFYTYDIRFNKFIQWQFKKLKQAGHITKGEHPVPWCPSCNNAVGGHDTKGDKDPELEEVTAIKFGFRDGFLVCTTYRPETLYGVTNIWVNPAAEHAIVHTASGEKLYVAKACVPALAEQMKLEIVGSISADEMIKHRAKNPLTGEMVPLLPASFVDPEAGTGIVMSVPAHAPYDYLALRDSGKEKEIPLKQVLSLEGFGKFPAKEIVERMGIKDQNDDRAEEATHEIYKKEAHTGVMVVGQYQGMKGMAAKDRIAADLARNKSAFKLYEISNAPVFCRCGGKCTVRIVSDQWFIDYGNPAWKEQAKECLKEMRILPEKTLQEYYYTMDWLKEKACTRATGLGTRFPFDETKMIEALSDSVVYMAFYTIAHHARELEETEFDEGFFDYVMLGKEKGLASTDSGAARSAKTGEAMKRMRSEFLYWYPLDSRHSATDLVHNHLTFFIFNHVGIFPKQQWPRQIVTNGFVLMDGKKMSKSMGNIMPLRAAIKEFGADTVRFLVASGADLPQDSDFNRAGAEGVISRLKYMESLLERAISESGESSGAATAASGAQGDEKESGQAASRIDKWMLSRLHRRVRDAPKMYEDFALRDLSQEIFYNTVNDLQWYSKRADRMKLREFFEHWTLLVAPFMPHIAEEFWQKLGTKKCVKDSKFVSLAQFPAADESKIDENVERGEDLVLSVREDIANILKLVKIDKPKKISLYVAPSWKRKVFGIVFKERAFDKSMKACMADPAIKEKGGEVSKLVEKFVKNIGTLGESAMPEDDELASISDACAFLGKEFGCEVSAARESEAPEAHAQKAKNALPMKPSIFIE